MILLDCDVLLDTVLERAEHAEDANALLDYTERADYPACMAWHTVANLHYIARPHYGCVVGSPYPRSQAATLDQPAILRQTLI